MAIYGWELSTELLGLKSGNSAAWVKPPPIICTSVLSVCCLKIGRGISGREGATDSFDCGTTVLWSIARVKDYLAMSPTPFLRTVTGERGSAFWMEESP